jgi:hypothetical protein
MVKTFYAAQKLRIQTFNRVVSKEYLDSLDDKFLLDLVGKKKFKKDDEKEKGARAALLKLMVEEYVKIHENIDSARTISKREAMLKANNGVIKDYYKYMMIKMCVQLKSQENSIETTIKYMVEQEPIWRRFLKQVMGCGPLMAAVMISEFNIHEARHVSSFWKYAGLDVVHNPETDKWEGRGKKAAHLIEVEYEDRDGKVQKKKSITYNPFLKTKLCGVLGSSFLKHPGPYRDVYDNYKHRICMRNEQLPKEEKLSDGHIHNMAIRYAVKMFLKDFYNAWRELEGYELEPDYWTKYVSGREHGATPDGVVQAKPNYVLLPEDAA